MGSAAFYSVICVHPDIIYLMTVEVITSPLMLKSIGHHLRYSIQALSQVSVGTWL
uniref:Uncharacterized protein n=1 Tax=Anguilla anguilla TaxID=7936 RepID=A0A0E9W709_ANGAN